MSPAYKLLAVPAFLLSCINATGCCVGAVQVAVPSHFHGRLTVHCTSTGSNDAPLRADGNGIADGPCPSVDTGVLVYSEGTPMRIARAPRWTDTHDGIPSAISIEVD